MRSTPTHTINRFGRFHRYLITCVSFLVGPVASPHHTPRFLGPPQTHETCYQAMIGSRRN